MIMDPLNEVGGKGLFLKQIERALLDGRVDLAVHSTKDVPVLLAPGLRIPCFTKREDPRDALISKKGQRLADLPQNARVGTCSLRRQSQLLHYRPDLEIVPLRGNVDTRIKKLETQELDAIVLAVSGLLRQGLGDWITEILPVEICLPAVGQGALAIETRQDDVRTNEFVSCLNDVETFFSVSAERGFLRRLGGGCQSPVAAHAVIDREGIVVEGMIASVDGREILRERKEGRVEEAEILGEARGKRFWLLAAIAFWRKFTPSKPAPAAFIPLAKNADSRTGVWRFCCQSPCPWIGSRRHPSAGEPIRIPFTREAFIFFLNKGCFLYAMLYAG